MGASRFWSDADDPDDAFTLLFFKKDVKRMMRSKKALFGTVLCRWAPLGAPGWVLTQVLTYSGFDLPGF